MRTKNFYRFAFAFGMLLLSLLAACAQTERDGLLKEQAQAEIATDNNQYVIGTEDVLYIHTWKEEALCRTVLVRVDGKISIPLIDDVQAAGYTPLQLKKILIEKFEKFIPSPSVSVIVLEPNSFKVYLSGMVKSPGVHKIRTQTTFRQLIISTGGLSEWANPKKIVIIRKENGKEKRYTVNYKKIVKGTEPDFTLKSGDIVIVP